MAHKSKSTEHLLENLRKANISGTDFGGLSVDKDENEHGAGEEMRDPNVSLASEASGKAQDGIEMLKRELAEHFTGTGAMKDMPMQMEAVDVERLAGEFICIE